LSNRDAQHQKQKQLIYLHVGILIGLGALASSVKFGGVLI
jgi:F0F1-type ATP synthase membrane subunit c/vacuolar-type H+-ATPase subunit K